MCYYLAYVTISYKIEILTFFQFNIIIKLTNNMVGIKRRRLMDNFKLDHYISTKGLNCRMCGQPIDTKTTITMLCSQCKKKVWAEKQRAAFKTKYGIDNPMKDRHFVDKIRETMLRRYGVDCAMNVPEFRNKFIETCKDRYGVSYFVNSPECFEASSCKSKINEKFFDKLKEIYPEAEQEKECDDKRFDFRIKSIKTYIEIDPTYTHNVAGNHWETNGQPKTQQLVKTLIAESHDYRCIHVFDWDDWEDIIDLIRPKSRVFARQCDVRVIQDSSFNSFIDENHIQKRCKGTKIAVGLYYQDALIQVMTFGNPRYNKNYKWELLRLCTKYDNIIIGGPQKIFNLFVKSYQPKSIISYCNLDKFDGRIYAALGFSLLKRNAPSQIWYNPDNGKLFTQKSLVTLGPDKLIKTNYGKGTSNMAIMENSAYESVYNCGQNVYIKHFS